MPTVTIAREDFLGVLYNAAAGLGLPAELARISFPIDQFLVDSDIEPLRARAAEVVAGLTEWTASRRTTGVHTPEPIRIEANGYEAALDQLQSLFIRNAWGDGLPLAAASPERVAWILRGTDRDPDALIGKIMPKGGIATVRTITIALAMAGGRPEYLPVLLAAVEAFLDPAMEHDKLQATSGSTFPVVIVNGPIGAQIRLNSGFGLLGPDPQHPAGASIGRALRLLQQNVGGALPGSGTMSIYGAMRYTNVVFAEDEEGLPPGWLPVASEHGGATEPLAPGASAVTVYVATGASNIVRRGLGKEAPLEEAEQGLARVVSYLASASVHYAHGWATGTPGALLIPRPVARQLANLGWTSKRSIREHLFSHATLTARQVRESGLKQWIEAAADPRTVASVGNDPWTICRDPDQIIIAVAGGAHPTHNFWMQAMSPGVVRRSVQTPRQFEQLLDSAEIDLGPSGAACMI